jgi:AraC-like DNA-binding protein
MSIRSAKSKLHKGKANGAVSPRRAHAAQASERAPPKSIKQIAKLNQTSQSVRFDILTDVMDQVRLDGTLYFRTVCNGAYAIEIARQGRTPFYAVQEGECELKLQRTGEVYRAVAGDFLLLPNAAPHLIGSGQVAPVLTLEQWVLLHPMDDKGRVFALSGNGPLTRVTGGFFDTEPVRINPLLQALPAVIHLRGSDAAVQRWLTPTLDFIHVELDHGHHGAQTVLRRLADVLFIQAVRAYAAQQGVAASWLRGLSDRRVARVLSLLHRRFAEDWTLESLAREVGMSRTSLAVQFKALVGESPMSYLTRWRITRAANLLRSDSLSLTQVAESVGYSSDTVFAKAFRRVTGVAPGRYRREPLASSLIQQVDG